MNRARILLLAFPALSADTALSVDLPPPAAPLTVPDIVRQAAIEEGVRPEFALGIAYRESRYEPGVVSSKGAMGVMQLMPHTAEALGVHDPFDALQNIRGGVRWLGELVREYGSEAVADCIYGSGHPEGCEAR